MTITYKRKALAFVVNGVAFIAKKLLRMELQGKSRLKTFFFKFIIQPFQRMAKKRSVAVRTSPFLWEACKRDACSMGNMCKHSARKMQWAVHCYKSRGGKYKGKKRSDNSMVRWTKQKWRTFDGSKSGGKKRYLPSEAWKHLTKSQIRRTNKSKKMGFEMGKQFVKQPKDVSIVAKRYR